MPCKGEESHSEVVRFNNNRWRCHIKQEYFMDNVEKRKSTWNKGGRPVKIDPAVYRYSVNFNAVENARFMSMFDESGLRSKALFIKARIFNESFRVIKTDRGTMDFATKLTQFYSQFRAIGVNYNQIVKELRTRFSERKALALLYKLEKITIELVKTNQQVIELTEKLKEEFVKRE